MCLAPGLAIGSATNLFFNSVNHICEATFLSRMGDKETESIKIRKKLNDWRKKHDPMVLAYWDCCDDGGPCWHHGPSCVSEGTAKECGPVCQFCNNQFDNMEDLVSHHNKEHADAAGYLPPDGMLVDKDGNWIDHEIEWCPECKEDVYVEDDYKGNARCNICNNKTHDPEMYG